MKLHLRISVFLIALLAMVSHARAQQVNTVYFLENAPMRHVINPAFQPVSNFYMTFPAVGYTSLWAGNNKLSLGDLVFNDGRGNTITALHPNAEGQLWNKLPNILNVDADIHLSLFGFGWRIREKGYAHFNITERIITEVGMPKSMFGPLLQQDLNTWDFSSLRASATVYTDIALGYSHIINEHWTVGGKLKILLGCAAPHHALHRIGLAVRLVPNLPVFNFIIESVRPTLCVMADYMLANSRPLCKIRRGISSFFMSVLNTCAKAIEYFSSHRLYVL